MGLRRVPAESGAIGAWLRQRAVGARTGRGHRAVSVWSADGVLTNISFPASLNDPGCQGSVVNEAGVIYQSNANTSRPS